MRRRALLLLTSMAAALVVAIGVAMAESKLDQQQTSSSGEALIDVDEHQVQTFTAGVSGDLDAIAVYVGCCKDESGNTGGTPPGDLHAVVYDHDFQRDPETGIASAGFLRGVASTTFPASSFSTDGTLEWQWIDTRPASVEAGKRYGIQLYADSPGPPYYLWAYNDPGGYSGGELLYFDYDNFGWESRGDHDAAFQTYVTAPTGPVPETEIWQVSMNARTSSTTARFGFSANEADATFECKLDGGAFEGCASPKEYSGLAEGSHTFEVRAKNRFGTDETPDSHTWYVDLTVPKVEEPTTPTNGALGVARKTSLKATFSERIASDSVTNSTFKLYKCSSTTSTTCTTQITNVAVALVADSQEATLNPYGMSSTLLASTTKYKAVVTTGAKDLVGNALDQDPSASGSQPKEWYFTTGRT